MLIARNVSERVFYLELNSARNKDLIYQVNWGRGFSEQPPAAFYPVQRSALYAWLLLSCSHPWLLFLKIHLSPNTPNPFLSRKVTFINTMLTDVCSLARVEP